MFIFRLEIGVNDEWTRKEIVLLCVTGWKLVLIYDNDSKVLIFPTYKSFYWKQWIPSV